MDLQFYSLKLTNFKAFVGDPTTLSFFDYPNGLSMLRGVNKADATGSNGAGKSTLWDALSWCLFGKTSRGLRNPDIKPWFGDKKTEVVVTVLIDGEPHEIKRTTNPNSICINDEHIGQEQVDALLHMNYATFIHTILLGQDNDLFYDLSATEKMQLFTDVLELSRWDARSAAASEQVKELDARRIDEEKELVALSSRIEEIDEYLSVAKKQAAEWEEDRSERLDVLEKELKELEALKDKTQCRIGSEEVDEDSANLEADQLEERFKDAYEVLFELRDAVTKKKESIAALRRSIKSTKSDLKDLGLADECPTCGQSVKGTDLDTHKKTLRKNIKKLERKIDTIDIEEAEKAYAKQEKKIEKIRPALEEQQAKVKAIRKQIQLIQSNMNDYVVGIKVRTKEREKLEEQENPHKANQAKLRKKRAAYVQSTQEIIATLKKLRRRIKRTKFWVTGFKDVRLFVLTEILMELEIATNSMLESVGLGDWSVTYNIEKETKAGTIKRGLNVLIHSPRNKEPVRWEAWSGGQRQRLRLCGSLALSQVLLSHAGIVPDLEILDEPTRSLSPEGVKDLCQFLSERAKDLDKQIWYTDHQSIESTLFSSVVTVVGEPSGSKLRE